MAVGNENNNNGWDAHSDLPGDIRILNGTGVGQ
jgi:hypothetical protein